MTSKTVMILCLITALPACTSEAETAYADPVNFEAKLYCTEADRDAPLVIPAPIMATIEAEDSVDDNALADALLVKAAMEVAHAASSEENCHTKFAKGEEIFATVLAGQRDALRKVGGFKRAKDKSLRPIQTEITRLWREDQSARGTYIGLSTEDKSGPEFWGHRLATAHTTRIDGESKRYIEGLLEQYDWIDRKRFDGKVSDHAWILVQHSDDHPAFQAKVLARMEPYLKNGGVKPKNYAYLWDRVAVNHGRKQSYGTQPTWECSDGKLELEPLEDPENVNVRRKKMGLNTVEEGLANMAKSVCR